MSKATTAATDAYSSFEGTTLAADLHSLGVTRVFLAGPATDYCVLNAAVDARRDGFQVVLVETAWVLRRLYKASPEEIRETVNDLSGSRSILVENRHVVARAVATSEKNASDFVDAIIAASALDVGCRKVVSFDRGAVRAAMTLVE